MGWIKVVILCWLMPLLHGHKECTQRIRWKDLLTEVDSLVNTLVVFSQYFMVIPVCINITL